MSRKVGKNQLVPKVRQSIMDFLYDEEATIPRSRLLMVGSIMVVLAVLMNIQEAFAGHGSHSSHSSHKSHSSHSSHSNHSNHANHQNATPKPTATPHASHNSYVSTSQSHFTVPAAPSGISSPSVNAAAFTSDMLSGSSASHSGATVTIPLTDNAAVAVVPTPTPTASTMQVPQLPPDTPRL
jgi:hypothetical protein